MIKTQNSPRPVGRDAQQKVSPVPSFLSKWKIAITSLFGVLIVVGGAMVFMGTTTPASQKPMPKVVALTADDISTLIAKVARHIVIRTDEKPTVATIQDAQILRTQNPDFYKDAKNGDRLLIWSDKAVLYSTSQDKILSVLPIRIPAVAAAQKPTTKK